MGAECEQEGAEHIVLEGLWCYALMYRRLPECMHVSN